MDWVQFLEGKEALEENLGVSIDDMELYLEAFTHKSYSNECKDRELSHNERLEFLGDSILGLYVSDRLMADLPKRPEGELTSLRASLVNAASCAYYLNELGLASFLMVGKGEMKPSSRGIDSISADLFEAFIAAIYLDQGWKTVCRYMDDRVYPLMQSILESASLENWKALLQDYCQKNQKLTPTYSLLKEEGPEHDKDFLVGVYLDDEKLAEGRGKTKKEAEKQASENALKGIGEEDGSN